MLLKALSDQSIICDFILHGLPIAPHIYQCSRSASCISSSYYSGHDSGPPQSGCIRRRSVLLVPCVCWTNYSPKNIADVQKIGYISGGKSLSTSCCWSPGLCPSVIIHERKMFWMGRALASADPWTRLSMEALLRRGDPFPYCVPHSAVSLRACRYLAPPSRPLPRLIWSCLCTFPCTIFRWPLRCMKPSTIPLG